MSYTTTALAGYGGTLVFNGITSLEVRGWNGQFTVKHKDVSYMTGHGGDHSRRFIALLKGGTGEAEAQTISTITLPDPSALTDDGNYNYTSILTLKTAASGGVTYSGHAAIKTIGMSVDAKGFGLYKFTFRFSGAITITLPA